MRCYVCSETLSRRQELSTSVVCRTCAQVVLQNMSPQTLADLGRQSDDYRQRKPASTSSTEWREFRGVF
jgi:hypothetical protein